MALRSRIRRNNALNKLYQTAAARASMWVVMIRAARAPRALFCSLARK